MSVPAGQSRLLTLSLVLFAVGLVAVVTIFVLAAGDRHAPWLWLVSMLLPIGLILAVWDAVRRR